MSDALRCKGKFLGWIHSYTGDKVTKFNLEMDGISGLEQLCKLSDGENLEIEGMPPMTYREFKENILSRTKRIYLSSKDYVLDFHS